MFFRFVFILLAANCILVADSANVQRLLQKFQSDADIQKLMQNEENNKYIAYWINLFNSTEIDVIEEVLKLPTDDVLESEDDDDSAAAVDINRMFDNEEEEKEFVEQVKHTLNSVVPDLHRNTPDDLDLKDPEEMVKFLEMGSEIIEILRQLERLQEIEEALDEDFVNIDENRIIAEDHQEGETVLEKADVHRHFHPKAAVVPSSRVSNSQFKAENKSSSTSTPVTTVSVVLALFGVIIVVVVIYKRGLIHRYQVRLRNFAFRRMRE